MSEKELLQWNMHLILDMWARETDENTIASFNQLLLLLQKLINERE